MIDIGNTPAYAENRGRHSSVFALNQMNYKDARAKIWQTNLKKEGHRAFPYHTGLKSKVRAETKEKFIKDDVEIIVATVAFGRGIDKSNVRFVIH